MATKKLGRPKGNKYNTEMLFEIAKTAIEENNLFFINDILAWLPCSKPIFYKYIPTESTEYIELTEMLDRNKIRTKSSIRSKLFKGTKASELLALYRLICTPDEHQKLNQSYIDHTSKGDKMNIPVSTWIKEDE